jgi:predicted DNA-binding transcriptional regulator YafY
VEIGYTGSDGRRSRRIVHPYGIVAHSGRWYVTGGDPASGDMRTFRVDRISDPRPSSGFFDVPPGFDPADALLQSFAGAPHRYAIAVRVEGTVEDVRRLFPPGLATVHECTDRRGHVRVLVRAERLDWVPAVLAGIDRPFVIEGPAALRPLVRALADRLAAATRETADVEDPRALTAEGLQPAPHASRTGHRLRRS